MSKGAVLPYLSILFLSAISVVQALPLERSTQWYLSTGSAIQNNTISLEVSERLFDRAHLIMQTRYASYDLEPFEDPASLFIPQMTSLWEQACLVQLASKTEQKSFVDLGFGYELRRYTYYDIFEESIDYFWEPSFIVPITFHLNSFFHNWDASSDLKIIMEASTETHSRTTLLTQQMFCLSKLQQEVLIKLFAMHHYTAFHDTYFSPLSSCRFGFIIEGVSR